MLYSRVFILIVCFLSTLRTPAQVRINYFFRHINQADGLLHNDVLSIKQDNKGFIWIVTANGLQRYDGLNFINYTDRLSNPTRGFGTGVEMYADKKNNLLWIEYKNNIERMEYGKTRFAEYDPQKLLKDSFSSFSSFSEANNQKWLLGLNALYYYKSISEKYTICYVKIHPANAGQSSYLV